MSRHYPRGRLARRLRREPRPSRSQCHRRSCAQRATVKPRTVAAATPYRSPDRSPRPPVLGQSKTAAHRWVNGMAAENLEETPPAGCAGDIGTAKELRVSPGPRTRSTARRGASARARLYAGQSVSPSLHYVSLGNLGSGWLLQAWDGGLEHATSGPSRDGPSSRHKTEVGTRGRRSGAEATTSVRAKTLLWLAAAFPRS